MPGKVYCEGITDAADSEGDYYLLATAVQNKGYEIEFYRTPPDVRIDHDDFKLIHFKSWCKDRRQDGLGK